MDNVSGMLEHFPKPLEEDEVKERAPTDMPSGNCNV